MSRKGKKLPGLPSRSPSLESTASQQTAPSPRLGRKPSIDGLSGAPIAAFGQYLFDSCAAVIICPKHHNIALTKIGHSKGSWLPYVALKSSEGWYMAVVARLKQLLIVGSGPKNFLAFSKPEMIHILRVQVPSVARFVTRVTYYTQLIQDSGHPTTCCQPSKTGLYWVSCKTLMQHEITDLWGPEPLVFNEAVTTNSLEKGAYTEYTLRDAMKYLPREQPKTFQDEMLKSAQFTEKDVQKIYAEFIQHVYPSQYMTLASFNDYMRKLGWNQNELDLQSCFRAFGFNGMGYLSFHEFLLGIAALDKHTQHGGHSGELRCGYIFRYYDVDGNGLLDHNEMIQLTRDALKLKNKTYDDPAIEAEMANNCKALKKNSNDAVTLSEFLNGVGTMAFRGSSALFRSLMSIQRQINLKRSYDSLSQLQSMDDFGPGKQPRGTCPRCRSKKYFVAMHSVKVAIDGTIVDPQVINQDDAKKMPIDRKEQGEKEFSGDNIANRILDWIREFVAFSGLLGKSSAIPKKTGNNFWQQSDRDQLARAVLNLCVEAEKLFKSEPRLIKVNSPIYVLGDIHGNLHDLLVYERILWEKGPTSTAASYLFLGDYVDRGEFGLECVLYLLCFKVLNPERYFLLRGNHELRPIQTVFTFRKECNEKFGKCGHEVWEACNKVFDVMPLCAIVDEAIFCAHGGIPASVSKVEELNQIPTPLPDPENESAASWEILWNDPVSGNEFSETAEMLRLQSGSNAFANLQGFLPNTKRGTAYYFSEEAVTRFLTANRLSHIIRAHEVRPPGYCFHIGGKVITVFSSSKYCGGLNEAACIFIEQEKLRVLRLDTNTA